MTASALKVKSAIVLDANDSMPQFLSDYDEDGQRRVCNPDHAWFILVTAPDGSRWSSRELVPFDAWGDWLEVGKKDYKGRVVKRAGLHITFVDEAKALASKAVMEKKAAAILAAGILNSSDADNWNTWWAGPAYGSAGWEAHEHAIERQENWGHRR